MSQSKKAHGKWKSKCQEALKTVEEFEDSVSRTHSLDRSLAYKIMELAQAQIEERTALLCVNPPQGQVVSTQESENGYVNASNQLVEGEFETNDFEQTFNDTVYEGQFFRVGWWKTRVDYEQYGLKGQKGAIVIERVDVDDIHVSPGFKRLKWQYLDYVIQESDHDIGDLRETYPISGFEISDFSESSQYSSMMDERSQDLITSPLPKMNKGAASKRQHIKVYEAWFKDTRLKFIAERETVEEFDDDGQLSTEVDRVKVDEDGYVIGDWVPMYPKGRCVIICEDTVLEDMPNRLPHGSCPYIPIQFGPAKNPFIPGTATKIITVADKINDIMSRSHEYAQSETTRPMHCELGTFANAQHYKRVPNQSNKMLVLNQGKTGTLLRPQPVELPAYVWEMMGKYEGFMDMISGSSGVMRGSIADGAQISAEALASLQTFASSRVALEAKYLMSAVRELYRQVFWLVRRVYDENIEIQVTNADGSNTSINWESDKEVFEGGDEDEIAKIVSKEQYLVKIKAGTGTPNAAQARKAEADHLFDRKAIDRPALLDAYEYPDRQNVNKRIDNREGVLVAQEAMGRKLGMNIVKAEKKADGAGRREKFD